MRLFNHRGRFAGLALLGLAAACGPMPENEFRGKYGTRVFTHADGRFEVAPETGAPRAAYWCAAGEYARRARGAALTDRVYVTRKMGPGELIDRKSTVTFSLEPTAQQGEQSWIYRGDRFRPGDSQSVQAAEGRCSGLRSSARRRL